MYIPTTTSPQDTAPNTYPISLFFSLCHLFSIIITLLGTSPLCAELGLFYYNFYTLYVLDGL